jgi:protein TonB
LRVRVAADGRVLAAEVHSGSGVAELDAAALQAVRGWRFESALQAGSPVEQEIAVPVNFVIAEPKK